MIDNFNYSDIRGDAVLFGFGDAHSASLAFATLQELGYSPVRHGIGELHVHLNRGDLSSALEIAMAHGGQPLDSRGADGDDRMFASTYDLDAIPIPAHLVNEEETASGDWTMGGSGSEDGRREHGEAPVLYGAGDPDEDILPGHDDYGFFSGDVRA